MTSFEYLPPILSAHGKEILDNFTDHVWLVKFEYLAEGQLTLIPHVKVLKKKTNNTVGCFLEGRGEPISVKDFFSEVIEKVPSLTMPHMVSMFKLHRTEGQSLSETYGQKFPKFARRYHSHPILPNIFLEQIATYGNNVN